jgi:signal transduction histidine kinase
LIDNALKAIEETDNGTSGHKLTIRLWDDGNWARLEVKDSGIGMDADHLSKIFKPFYTKRKNLQGTGLGLAIVKKIIEEAHGSIDVTSEPGKGTTFLIAIPALA